MKIGELAKLTHTSVRSIRHYEKQNLIRANRSSNGYREFGLSTVSRVRKIRGLLACGFTTEEIRLFLPCLDDPLSDHRECQAGLQAHLKKLNEISTLIDQLNRKRTLLLERVAHFDVSRTMSPQESLHYRQQRKIFSVKEAI